MTQTTLWYRATLDTWVFNHLSQGHEQGRHPAPKHPNHRPAWSRGEWSRKHAWLTDTVPPKVVHFGPEDL